MFALICIDKSDSLGLRMSVREAHMTYVRALPPGFLILAGPFLSEAGEMCGSLFLIEAADEAAVRAFHAADPYAKAGLFERVELRPWRATIYPP
ncbi:MAG TPA: YciI family protein [Caulobacteraceae bacterium]